MHGWDRLPGEARTVVAVVDDDTELRMLLGFALGDEFEVDAHESAEAFLRSLASGAPAARIILTDLDLGGRIDGEELARRASELPGRPRVVLMSGDPGRLAQAAPLGTATVAKPFHLERMVSLLRALAR